MRNFSKIFMLLLFVILSIISQAQESSKVQVWKYKTTDVYYRQYNQIIKDFDEWKNHNQPALLNMLIVLDLPKEKITMYSPEVMDFNIIKLYPSRERDNTTYIEMDCVDPKNNTCVFTMCLPNNGKEPYLYQQYKAFELMYYLKVLN